MSNEGRFPLSIPASGDLSASQYCAVTTDVNGNLALPAAGANIIGILYTKPAALGRAGAVMPKGSGRVKGKAGAAITLAAGVSPLKIDASGRFITGIVGTDVIVGYALTAAGALGDLIELILT